MANFAGKVILISGAASGNGAAMAAHFAKLGGSLALNDKDPIEKTIENCVHNGLKREQVKKFFQTKIKFKKNCADFHKIW